MKIDIDRFISLKQQIDACAVPGDRGKARSLLADLSALADAMEPVFSDDLLDSAAVWGYISDSFFRLGMTKRAADASERQLDDLIAAHRTAPADRRGSILDCISDALYNIIEYRNLIKIDTDLAAGRKFSDDTCDEVMDKVRDILQDAPNVYIHATNRAKNAERRRPEEHYDEHI